MEESHLKVNSIRLSAEANFVMTESCKDLVFMTSVSNCNSMDIRQKSKSLPRFILFSENDLIRFNTRSTRDFSLPRSTEWGQIDPGYY